MTLDTWERLAPGRYATTVNGHTLQVIRNPDDDPRRYLPVVNSVPLQPPCFHLKDAKSKAIKKAFALGSQAVFRKTDDQARAAKKAVSWKPDMIKPPPDPDPALAAERVAAWRAAEAGAPDEPDDLLGLEYATYEEVPELPPEPPAGPLQIPPPAVEEAGAMLRLELSGLTLTGDSAASIAAIRAAVDLLREVPGAQDIKCRIHLPHPWVDI
jgi:hypothetical protein